MALSMIRQKRFVPGHAYGLRVIGAVLGLGLGFLTLDRSAMAQPPAANYDETKVGLYTLPDPLMAANGERVNTAAAWNARRRPEILRLFETYMYGKVPTPPHPVKPRFAVSSEDREALGGKAIRREVAIVFRDDTAAPRINLLVYLPKDAVAHRRVPVFVGLNFEGNHAVSTDPGITLPTTWLPNNPGAGITDHRATEGSRGAEASRWPVERILARGYALATAYYGDIDPDFDDGFKNGIHPLFYQPGQTRPADDQWGSIAAWAWGLGRMLDYLETAREIDSTKVAVMGHSRLGKTALWAGATDPRFAIVISNNSGAGGAAVSRRIFGETVAHLNKSFPHWFCGNFKKFSGREFLLPFDQHELISLIAPRPVLICSAAEDQWADPKGEFLGARRADPVYRLFGTEGLAISRWPEPATDSLIDSVIGYRIRPGKHDVTTADWDAYMNFTDHHFKLQEADRQDDGQAIVRQFEREAEALGPLVTTPLARDFLGAVMNLPAVTPRTVFRSADRRAFWSPDEAARLGAQERQSLEKMTLDGEFYYTTKYGTPLAYARPLEVLGRAGIVDAQGLKLLDFGYGTVGHLRLLASLGADVTGVDVDPLLDALYSASDDQGPVRGRNGRTGRLKLVNGRFPADPKVRAAVGSGFDLIISKNTLKNGYIHSAGPAGDENSRRLIDLGMTDAEFVKVLHDALKPGGRVLIYNLSPAPSPPGQPPKPWADGRCPFSRDVWAAAGFRVLEHDRDDSAAARAQGHALRWDRGDQPMDLEHDLFALYTLAEKPARK
jgi:SAM-dependent methyltransferase